MVRPDCMSSVPYHDARDDGANQATYRKNCARTDQHRGRTGRLAGLSEADAERLRHTDSDHDKTADERRHGDAEPDSWCEHRTTGFLGCRGVLNHRSRLAPDIVGARVPAPLGSLAKPRTQTAFLGELCGRALRQRARSRQHCRHGKLRHEATVDHGSECATHDLAPGCRAMRPNCGCVNASGMPARNALFEPDLAAS